MNKPSIHQACAQDGIRLNDKVITPEGEIGEVIQFLRVPNILVKIGDKIFMKDRTTLTLR